MGKPDMSFFAFDVKNVTIIPWPSSGGKPVHTVYLPLENLLLILQDKNEYNENYQVSLLKRNQRTSHSITKQFPKKFSRKTPTHTYSCSFNISMQVQQSTDTLKIF